MPAATRDRACPTPPPAAIELLHCASLVHDDLPCFDDAATRRGKPSVHRAFGERLAVLAGDALIVLAFQTLAGRGRHASGCAPLLLITGGGVSACPSASSPARPGNASRGSSLADYQRAKTGALFAACAEAGRAAAGADPAPWRAFGDVPGRGLPGGRRRARRGRRRRRRSASRSGATGELGRPSAAAELGLGGAIEHFDRLVERSIGAIPDCDGAALLRAHGAGRIERLVPQHSVRDLALAALAGACTAVATSRPPRRWPASATLAALLARALAGLARPPADQSAVPARAQRLWYLRPLVRRRARGPVRPRAPASSIRRCCWPACACARSRSWPKAPQTASALALRFDLPLPATERLLAAAVSLDLVEPRSGGRYGLGKLGAPLVGNEAVTAMVEHHAVLYADLQDPLALLRGAGRGAGAVALLGLCRGRIARRAAAFRGRIPTRR